MRPPGINNNGDDYKNERFREIREHILPFDIVCFQELFSRFNSRKDEIIKDSLSMGYVSVSNPPDPPFCSKHLIDSGLLTLSKHSILFSKFQPYSNYAGIDGVAFKGAHYCRIKVGDRILNLFNTHLQASYSGEYDSSLHRYFEAKFNQILELTAFIRDSLSRNAAQYRDESFTEPIIIVGDFNINSLAKKKAPKDFQLHSKKAMDWIDSLPSEGFYEYDFLIEALSDFGIDKIHDFMLDTHSSHKPTFGDSYTSDNGEEVPLETALTMKKDWGSKQCLDHIFQLFPNKITAAKLKGIHSVERMLCEVKDSEDKQLFTQLSDHYGVAIKVSI